MGQPNSPETRAGSLAGEGLLAQEILRAGRLIERFHAGWRVLWRPVVDSTQAEAARCIADGATKDQPFLVVAGHQEAGHGRGGRRWVAPPNKALLFTAAMPLPLLARGHSGMGRPAEEYPPSLWPLQVGLTLFIRLWSFGWKAGLKWPNDLLVEDHKVGGILCEGRQGWLLVGVGLNLLQRREDFAAVEGARVPPGSLVMFPGEGSPSPEQLAPTVLQSVVSVLEAPWSSNWMLEHYRKWCSTLGRRVLLPDGTVGQARDIDGMGRLAVEKDDGTVELVSGEVQPAGEVLH